MEHFLNCAKTIRILKREGYNTFSNIKDFTWDILCAIPGMGEVSAQRTIMELEEFRNSLHKEVVKAAKELADRVGVERAIEIIETEGNNI